MGKYKVFSTTADVGIKIEGNGFEDFYKNALNGVNALIFGNKWDQWCAHPVATHPFSFKGDSAENVLINLLSEVIFLLYTKNKMTVDMNIKRAANQFLEADLLTVPPGLEPEIEIKSVTYHNLNIMEKNGIKSAEIIFDI